MTPFDLARPRELGEILGDAIGLFRRHSAVFLTLTLVVVAPVGLLVDGVWGRALIDGGDARPPAAAQLVSVFLSAFVMPTFVTALHVRVVEGLGRGEAPSIGIAFRRAAPVVAPAVAVVTLAALGVLLGTLAFIIPGIWLGVRWYLSAQAVVVEGARGRAALQRSGDLVAGQWGHTFSVLLCCILLFGLLGAVIAGVMSAGGGALYVAGQIIGQSLSLSLTAIAGTLLYFDLRARHEEPWRAVAP